MPTPGVRRRAGTASPIDLRLSIYQKHSTGVSINYRQIYRYAGQPQSLPDYCIDPAGSHTPAGGHANVRKLYGLVIFIWHVPHSGTPSHKFLDSRCNTLTKSAL